MGKYKQAIVTLAIAFFGGIVGHLLDFPAGMLIGGMVAVTIAALIGAPAEVPRGLRDAAFVVIGMTLGTSVAQDSLQLIVQWPVTMIGLALSMIVMVATSTFVLIRLFKLDRGTAYLSSFPGHLSFVLAMAETGYGDSRKIAVIQSIRIFMLILFLPIVVKTTSSIPIGSAPTGEAMDWLTVLILGSACIFGSFVFARLKVPAAYVLGSMSVAILLKLMGVYEGTLPFVMQAFGYVVIGALIGSRFTGIKITELGRNAVAGLVVTLICVIVVSVAAYVATWFTVMPFGQIWLGLGPGALETMGVLGIVLGFDAAFIAAHHTARFFLLTAFVPTVAAFVGEEKSDAAEPQRPSGQS